jgi:hypothetical protein
MSDFPTASDLQSLLTRLGVSGTTAAERQRYLDAAIDALQTLARCRPWVPTRLIQRYHGEHLRLLSRFPAYLLPSEAVKIAVNGIELSSSDYIIHPDSWGRASWVQLKRPASGEVSIDAMFGFAPNGDNLVPEDVWHAVLLDAAAYALREYRPTPPDQLIESLKQGDLQIKYAQGQYQSPLESVARRYERRWL